MRKLIMNKDLEMLNNDDVISVFKHDEIKEAKKLISWLKLQVLLNGLKLLDREFILWLSLK